MQLIDLRITILFRLETCPFLFQEAEDGLSTAVEISKRKRDEIREMQQSADQHRWVSLNTVFQGRDLNMMMHYSK